MSLPGGPPSHRSAPGTFSHGDALALLLGLVSVVCLTIVMGELLNETAPSPISASLFVLCAIGCVAVLRRQRAAAAASRALEHAATILSTSHHPRPPSTLDHEARRSLFDYFVFGSSHPAKGRGQEKENDDVEDSSSISSCELLDDRRRRRGGVRDAKEEEESAVTASATATAAPGADSKIPPSEEIGMPRGAPEDWTTAVACVVCFGEYVRGDNLCRLPCRHTYHAQCIDKWLDKANHPCCPMCKADLLALYLQSVVGGGTVATIAASGTADNATTTPSPTTTNNNNNNNDATTQPVAADSQENTDSA